MIVAKPCIPLQVNLFLHFVGVNDLITRPATINHMPELLRLVRGMGSLNADLSAEVRQASPSRAMFCDAVVFAC